MGTITIEKKVKKLSVSNDDNSYCISEFKYQREKVWSFTELTFAVFWEINQQTK